LSHLSGQTPPDNVWKDAKDDFIREVTDLNLHEVLVRPAHSFEERRFGELMGEHHYLGALPKISETVLYVAVWRDQWVALLSFSAAALKCTARDRFIGWDFRRQYSRLKLITNNSRFLILPQWHHPNLGSRVLSLCEKRLAEDWREAFGHPVLLLETFVDPLRFRGTVYKAANWRYVGDTRGFRRTRQGYSDTARSPKMVFVKLLKQNAQTLLSQPVLDPAYRIADPKMKLSADQMRSLPDFFKTIADPRRAQGRRHRLATVLAIAAGAVLCGMRGYQAISDWAESLGQKARQRFGCRRHKGRYIVPSLYIIRDVLIRVDPVHLDRAINQWNQCYGKQDESLAIDGKTMCNAIDEDGRRSHIMSAVGHRTKVCYAQKKWAPCQ
jgi:hypothetical protein